LEEGRRQGGEPVSVCNRTGLQHAETEEVKPYNIRTTVISPGAVATELPNSVTDPKAAERIHKFYARGELHIRRIENGLERPGGRSRPAPRHLASLVAADAFAG
jgi:NAD(P)-dependent dehydrogenase (short-subunit alcohol dehydrogenase family)